MKINVAKALDGYPGETVNRVARNFDQLCELCTDKQWLEQFVARYATDFCQVCAASEFIGRFCTSEVDAFIQLVDSGDLDRGYPQRFYEESLRHQLAGVENDTQLMKILRRFRNREMVRIAWRDIAGIAKLNEVMYELSCLADACIRTTLSLLHDWQVARLGEPVDKHGNSQQLIVIAMGKLGAHELNFSSDIDLVFVYPESGNTVNGPKALSNEEFFARLGRQFIAAIDNQTADGFVFRVDMRLRPFGESGSLVASLDAIENYYLTHGREWERYAMIKARIVCGHPEFSDELMQTLRPFVYRRYLDYGAYDSLRDMKQRIVSEVKRKGIQENIKLGAGGIREIEFIGQAFQLIRGGRNPDLQQKQILNVLDVLRDSNILPAYVVDELKQAYVFLRMTEHRLQEYDDKQTHKLPASDNERQLLALAMGFANWDEFATHLNRHREHVRNHFDQVFAAPQIDQSNDDKATQMHLVWTQQCDIEQSLEILARAGYDEPQRAMESIANMRSTARFRALTNQSRLRLNQLMPMLIEAVAAKSESEDLLSRILLLIETIYKRVSYLALLSENPMALSQLVKLCAASPWIVSQLQQHPMLLDELLDPRTLYHPPSRDALVKDMARRLSHVNPDDLEQNMDVLRHFKQTNMLRVAAADVSGAVPLMIVSDHLTYIAEIVLQASLDTAWTYLVARHGLPGGEHIDEQNRGFAIIAYGKLGGIELSYGSDLDLVFLYNADPNGMTLGEKSISNSVFYSRLGQRLIHILTTFTPAGELYEVDMRLRPSGASGLLVTHIESFEEYQTKKAWTWEHQALVRARAITGDTSVIEAFTKIRSQVLSRSRGLQALCKEVVDMRERMRKELASKEEGVFDIKQDQGGIADIEFMVQYMVLGWAAKFDKLLTYSDNVRILDAIAENALMHPSETKLLADAYRSMRSRAHKLALKDKKAVIQEGNREEIEKLSADVTGIWQKYMNCDAL